MNKPWFTLKTRDDVARKMPRAEYYEHRRFLRVTQRMMTDEMEKHKDRIEEEMMSLMIYGVSPAAVIMPKNYVSTDREW